MESLDRSNNQERQKEFITHEPFVVQQVDLNTFLRLVPAEFLERHDLQLVPTPTEKQFELKARESEEINPPSFKNTAMITHVDGSRTFIAEFSSDQSADEVYYHSEYIHVIDDLNGKYLGFGEVRYVPGPAREDVFDEAPLLATPYVDNIETEAEYLSKGLGARRYLVMEQLSLQKWGKHLHAGEVTSEDAIRVWNKFISEGRARKLIAKTVHMPTNL